MRTEDVNATGEVGDGARHPQDAMLRMRRKLQQIDRVIEHRLVFAGKPARHIGARLIDVRVAPTRLRMHG